MNTWRDIKTDPPQINWPVNPVFVTDGKNVYFGRLMWDPDALFFRGCSLQKGDSIFVPASELTEWQPAPDTWGAEKSADELFRDLGYQAVGTTDHPVYEDRDKKWSLEITDDDGAEIWADYNGLKLRQDTILALAQLIREMERRKHCLTAMDTSPAAGNARTVTGTRRTAGFTTATITANGTWPQPGTGTSAIRSGRQK